MQSLPASQQKESENYIYWVRPKAGMASACGWGGSIIWNVTWGLAWAWNFGGSWDLNKWWWMDGALRDRDSHIWSLPQRRGEAPTLSTSTKSEPKPPKTTTVDTDTSAVFEFHLRKFRGIQGLTFSKPQRQSINHRSGISSRGQENPTC